jgi:hypothetical protein
MKRNLLLLAVMVVASLFISGQSWAQDLGIPDTVYIETFNCDHTYEATAGYDSVRIAIFVTHDSNTFYWQGGQRYVQDSIASFVIPLTFDLEGCADSVVFAGAPPYGTGGTAWNNNLMDRTNAKFNRSMFRDLVDNHTGETFYNRFADMNEAGWTDWSRTMDIVRKNPGHVWLNMTPTSATCQRWWEGSRVLFACMTFMLYMGDDCDSSAICFDSTFWPPSSHLSFVRYDAAGYTPNVPLLPVCDTEYIIPCLPPNITCPSDESKPCNGTYTTTTKWSADAGGSDGILLTTVNLCGSLPPGISGVTVNIDPPGLPAASATGTVTYTVSNHCAAGGPICLIATNDCAPPLTDQCTFNVTFPPNQPPTITCPANVTGPYGHGNLVSADYTNLFDECGVPAVTMTFSPASPPLQHAPVLIDKHVEWQGYCTESVEITLTATDDNEATAQCTFTMTSTNQEPTCSFDLPGTMSINDKRTINFTYDDPNGVGTVTGITVDAFGCGDITDGPTYSSGSGTFEYTAPADAGWCTVCMTVTDENGLTHECCDSVEIITAANQVIIPNKVYERFGYAHWVYPDTGIYMDDACEPYNGVNPGDFFEIPIILNNFQNKIGGFELEVEYDYIDLTFYGAEPGILLSQRWYTQTIPDSTLWSWEYFTYRVLPCPLCACCKYKILLYGQAEMPDGLYRRGYCIGTPVDDETYWGDDYATYIHKNGEPERVKVGATLVWLKFQVANNELLRDLKLPVVFEWEHKLSSTYPYHIIQDWDCAENTFSSCDGSKLYVSKNTMQYDPTVCPDLPADQLILDFIDGGVHICSICTAFVCVRGDVNMDGNAYTTADAVMFARALVFGAENVFQIDLAKQKCATDANADGRNMMLSDLIYMIRVIQHDATPFPKLGPSSDVANLIVSDGRITVECASAIGGLLFEFDGAVTPTLLNTNMELLANEGKVLVWSSDGNSINAGASELLSVTGAQLVSVTAVDREGRDLATTITTKLAPSTFALHPAYPNPFNPFTNLSFTLPNAVPYSMNIYNVAGQLVRSYEGMGNAGLNVITWDGKDNAGNSVSSGVYFCKFSAGNYTATNKMVMMK